MARSGVADVAFVATAAGRRIGGGVIGRLSSTNSYAPSAGRAVRGGGSAEEGAGRGAGLGADPGAPTRAENPCLHAGHVTRWPNRTGFTAKRVPQDGQTIVSSLGIARVHFSSGSFASFQPRYPPSIEMTLVYPIFWRLSAAKAERNPPPQ